MEKISLSAAYVPSENVVAREVAGEFVIIPVTSGVGDAEDEIFTLNETGLAIWKKLDGKRSLKAIAKDLSSKFEGGVKGIEKDVLGLTKELLKRKMLVKAGRN